VLYFDHNATTPLLPEAQQAWLEASANLIGNPSSPHRLGGRAEVALQAAREQLAGFLGCDALDLVWTSGATESAATVFHHAARTLPADAEVWVSALEHPCVLDTAVHLFPGRLRLLPALGSGAVARDWFRQELGRNRPGLVALMAANNETGVLQPWRECLHLCREWEVPFFCDAAQWIGKLPAQGLGGADYVSGCAHKFGGPRGVGFLKCPPRPALQPLLRGGKQEEGRRAGTENVAGVLAMVAALAHRETALAAGEHVTRALWRATFEKELLRDLPGTEILGAGEERLWNTVSVLMPPGDDCRPRWVVKLDKAGFAVSTGSACASGREEPSPVLTAMGRTPAEAGRALRFSSGWETRREDWTALLEGLRRVHQELTAPRQP
jgi:cysteine desulfurase